MSRLQLALSGCCLFAATALADPAAHSDSFAIKGVLDHPRTVTLADLEHEPKTAESVFLHTGHGVVAGSFTGISLWTLLQEAGVILDASKKNDIVRHVIIVTGTDGYSAILSIGDIDPEFGGDQAIIAYEKDGKPIEGPEGFARLIVPGDKAAGRAVGAIASIEVK